MRKPILVYLSLSNLLLKALMLVASTASWSNWFHLFTVHRNAHIAGAVLAMAIPSVCPSVTRRYCVKMMARSMVQFALSDSKMCLVL